MLPIPGLMCFWPTLKLVICYRSHQWWQHAYFWQLCGSLISLPEVTFSRKACPFPASAFLPIERTDIRQIYKSLLRIACNVCNTISRFFGANSLKVAMGHHLVARAQSCRGDFRTALNHEKEAYNVYKDLVSLSMAAQSHVSNMALFRHF